VTLVRVVGVGTVVLVSNNEVAFVDAREQNGAQVDRPDPVIDFLEPDVVRLERVGDEEELVLEPKRPGMGHALHEEVARIRERWKFFRIRPRGRDVECSWRASFEEFMRALLVVLGAEHIEAPLLCRERGAWRATGAGFERFVHALVRAVLLRRRGANPLMLDA